MPIFRFSQNLCSNTEGVKKIHEIFTTRGFFKTYYGKQYKYVI